MAATQTRFIVKSGYRTGVDCASGHSVPYDLYLPSDRSGSESGSHQSHPPSDIAVLLLHGFGGNRFNMRGHAQHLASRGVPAFTPDMTRLISGAQHAQLRNVALVEQHVHWLFDGCDGLIGGGSHPAHRLILVGHSAGGAVVLEAAFRLASSSHKSSRPSNDNPIPQVTAVVLLDAVPWSRTMHVAETQKLDPYTLLLSLRGEPSAWNRHNIVCRIFDYPHIQTRVSQGKALDVILHGARHGDPMCSDMYSSTMLEWLHLKGLDYCAQMFIDLLSALVADFAQNDNVASEQITFQQLTQFTAELTDHVKMGRASITTTHKPKC